MIIKNKLNGMREKKDLKKKKKQKGRIKVVIHNKI